MVLEIGGVATHKQTYDSKPSKSQRDAVYAAQLSIADDKGEVDMKALGHMLKVDLGSGDLSRMRLALRKMGQIARSVAPEQMPEAIEMGSLDAHHIEAALSQNIVPARWKEGPWEASTAARDSIDTLVNVLSNGAISLSEESLTSILQAIDKEGQKSGGLGGIKDFVAYGELTLARAKDFHVSTKAIMAIAAQQCSSNTKTVGDASDAAPDAEVGGRKSAGPGSLFALLVNEKNARS